ncbi:MAG: RNA polymerase sigma factor [Nitrospira sp.]
MQHTATAPRPSTAGRACDGMKAVGQPIAQSRLSGEEPFEAFVIQQQGRLIRMALRHVANRETAEEVVQETWLAVINGLDRFEGRSSLRAWICAILLHKAKDRGVREKRQKTFSDLEYDGDEYDGVVDPSRFRQHKDWSGHSAVFPLVYDDWTPESLLASKQAIACLQQAIEALPARLKEVLILRDAQGIETGEVCRRLNISESNLYVRLHRARERVRSAVEPLLR